MQRNQNSLFWGINLFLIGKSRKVLISLASSRKKMFLGEKVGQSFLLSQEPIKLNQFFFVQKFFRPKKTR